ncbi:carboxypeptidase regulatory-like domain-containing protein [Candidatus Kapabacteria bacterium]|nr:carboxypeptidase regulatory-like domain-containing protein [Candidatus Kapabacteria bacterium]
MSKLYKLILLSLSIAISFSCEENNPSTPNDTQTITGTITDGQDNPISVTLVEAYIELNSSQKSDKNSLQSIEIIASDTTNELGDFELMDLPQDLSGVMLRVDNTDFLPSDISKSEKTDGKYKIKLQRQEDCQVELSVEVSDSKGSKISDVKVQIKRDGKEVRNAKTNDLGLTNFEEVCPGNYEIRAFREGFKTIEQNIDIKSENKNISLTLQNSNNIDSCCGGEIDFEIKDQDGNALKDAKILLKKDGKGISDPRTDSDGKATIKELCEGKYTVVISKEGYETIEYEIDLGCDESLESNKTLTEKESECCDGVININIKDADGNPVKEAIVIIKRDGKAIADPRTDSDGNISVKELCEGKYTIVVEKEGFERIEWQVEVDCDKELNIEKTLEASDDECCESTLQFKITNDNGEAISGALVKIWKNGKVIKEAESDANGWVKLEDWCEGNYGVDIIHSEYKNIEFEFEIGCGVEKTFEKTLSEKESECCDGVINLNIKDADGNPVKEAIVIIKRDGKAIADPRTDSDGNISVKELCEGKYTIVVEKEGFERIEWQVEVDCDKELNIEKTLEASDDECCEGIIKVILKDADNLDYLSEVNVTFELNGKVITEGKTNGDGVFIAKELCLGVYKITFKKDGFDTKTIEWNLEKCDDFQETFKLSK